MGMNLTLKHVKQVGPGRYEFRRRVPEAVREAIGKGEFKRVFEASSPAAVAREHARVSAEFDRLVASAGAALRDTSPRTPRETAQVNRKRAEELLAGVRGPEDEEAKRDLLADLLAEEGADPALYRAVRMPEEPLPQHTLEDARKLYLAEHIRADGKEHRKEELSLDRVFDRLRAALGAEVVRTTGLGALRREDAKKVRDYLMRLPKRGGGTISPATVHRDWKLIVAVVNFGLREFDLMGKAANPFASMPIPGATSGVTVSAAERRDAMPDEVAAKVLERLPPVLALIWRILAGTGCRLAEVTGLRVEDVKLDHSIPHVCIFPNEVRSLKTRSSHRRVPLIGDALEAAREAVEAAGGSAYLFATYATPQGPLAVSSTLMRTVREERQNPRQTVHSLRHRMKDRLRDAGVDKAAQDLVLGHAADSVGEAYGGAEGRLRVAHRALSAALRGDAEGQREG